MWNWLRRALTGIGVVDAAEHPDGRALLEYLEAQLTSTAPDHPATETIRRVLRDPAGSEGHRLPELYLRVEQHLVRSDAQSTLSRRLLRRRVRDRFPDLTRTEPLRPIFREPADQELLLARRYLLELTENARDVLGATHDGVLDRLGAWLEAIPDAGPPPSPLDERVTAAGPSVGQLESVSRELYEMLEEKLGQAAQRMYEQAYRTLADRYGGLETFPIVVRLLPRPLLDSRKLQLLSYGRAGSRLEALREELSSASRELRRTRSELQAVLDTAGEGILTVDEEGTVVLANREVARMWDLSTEELEGTSIESLFAPPEDRADSDTRNAGWFVDLISDLLDESTTLTARRSERAEFPASVRAGTTRIHDRRYYTCSIRDVTAQKRYERALIEAKEEAEEMNRLKSAFLANMSHEIRTPLTSILGFSEILADEAGSQYAEYAELIQSSGERLMRTLNSVLDISQLEAEVVTPRYETVEIVAHVEESVALFRSRAREQALSLRYEHPDRPVHVRTDPGFLERIVNNLLDNALKFTQEGSVIVRLHTDEDHFALEVEDTGIGMEADFQQRLFEQFQQESTGMGRLHEGSGLGLAITHRLVELLDGTIEVESERGGGTTLSLHFPDLAEVHAEAETPDEGARRPPQHPAGGPPS